MKFLEEQSSGETRGSSEASLTIPTSCSAIREGGYVLLRGHPCKVKNINVSAPGKHGHSKVVIMGKDIFTSAKYEELFPSSHMLQVPEVTRQNLLLVDITEDSISLLLPNGHMKEDAIIKDKLRRQLIDLWNSDISSTKDILINVLSAMGQELVTSFKLVNTRC